MSSDPLSSCSVLVTRPKHQAEPFCQMLEQAGATVHQLPTLEIEGINPDQSLLDILENLQQQDMLIFTSRNAVEFALPWLKKNLSPFRDNHGKIVAIGKKTAELLEQQDIKVDIQPQANFNSETLLALPAMQSVTNNRILIIKGRGGRTLLAETLTSRGADVQTANLYRRKCPIVDNLVLTSLQSIKIDIITLTSVESCENLFTLLEGQSIPWLSTATLLLGSQRMQEKLENKLLPNPVWIAENPANDAMLAALLKWKTQ